MFYFILFFHLSLKNSIIFKENEKNLKGSISICSFNVLNSFKGDLDKGKENKIFNEKSIEFQNLKSNQKVIRNKCNRVKLKIRKIGNKDNEFPTSIKVNRKNENSLIDNEKTGCKSNKNESNKENNLFDVRKSLSNTFLDKKNQEIGCMDNNNDLTYDRSIADESDNLNTNVTKSINQIGNKREIETTESLDQNFVFRVEKFDEVNESSINNCESITTNSKEISFAENLLHANETTIQEKNINYGNEKFIIVDEKSVSFNKNSKTCKLDDNSQESNAVIKIVEKDFNKFEISKTSLKNRVTRKTFPKRKFSDTGFLAFKVKKKKITQKSYIFILQNILSIFIFYV